MRVRYGNVASRKRESPGKPDRPSSQWGNDSIKKPGLLRRVFSFRFPPEGTRSIKDALYFAAAQLSGISVPKQRDLVQYEHPKPDVGLNGNLPSLH